MTGFAAETDLCAAFIAAIGKDWTAYPETAGWDILLVRGDGFQIGIEAKLRLNAKVIAQTLEASYSWDRGPDCRAVLVPASSADLRTIADYIGITVIVMNRPCPGVIQRPFRPDLPTGEPRYEWGGREWHELCPLQRYELPDFVPDVAAGASAPVKLTDWKIKAIKIAVILEKRGSVTRQDFKALGIDIRRWLPREGQWLAPSEDGFIAGSLLPDFKGQHPVVYEQIAATSDDWMPKATAVQRALI